MHGLRLPRRFTLHNLEMLHLSSALPQPDVEFLIVCKHAEVLQGQLYLMGGGWDRVGISDFARSFRASLAIGVLVPWTDTNENLPLTVSMQADDGTVLGQPVSVNINVGHPSGAIPGQSFRALLAFNGEWLLPGPGIFHATAQLRDQSPKRTTFYVEQAPTAGS